MDGKKKATVFGVATGAFALLCTLVVIGLVVVYTGAYNVAATEEHASFVRWAFDTTFQNSVERRAPIGDAPAALTPAMIATGGRAYKSMCEHCHGGPGAKRADWASGMRPRPPHLAEAATEWQLNQVFWIAKHGVKMTGMPAFGPTHDDRTIWGIAAFVKELPAMTPERYAALGDASEQGQTDGGGQQQRGSQAQGGHPHGSGGHSR